MIIKSKKKLPVVVTDKKTLLARMKSGLKKTRSNLAGGLADLFLGQKQIDEDLLEDIETQLLMATLASLSSSGPQPMNRREALRGMIAVALAASVRTVQSSDDARARSGLGPSRWYAGGLWCLPRYTAAPIPSTGWADELQPLSPLYRAGSG